MPAAQFLHKASTSLLLTVPAPLQEAPVRGRARRKSLANIPGIKGRIAAFETHPQHPYASQAQVAGQGLTLCLAVPPEPAIVKTARHCHCST